MLTEKAIKQIIDATVDGFLIIDDAGHIKYCNEIYCNFLGYSQEEMKNKNFFELVTDVEKETIHENFKITNSTGKNHFKAKQKHKNGKIVEVDINTTFMETEDGKLYFIFVRDLTERNEIERRTYYTNKILGLYMTVSTKQEYLDKIMKLIHEWSECRYGGIRILNKEGFIPYQSRIGFSDEFLKSECNLLLSRDQCACTRVILEQPDPQDLVCMTPYGSFRCDHTFNYAKGLTETELSRFRGKCLEAGFTSVAVIPIRYKGKMIGAIHLADERENMVSQSLVESIESIVPIIGETIHRFDMEEQLKNFLSWVSFEKSDGSKII